MTPLSLKESRNAARSGYRRARTGVLVAALLLAGVLLATTFAGYRGSTALKSTVDQGQAAMHLHTLHRLAPPGPPPPTREKFEAVLADQTELGLRSIEIMNPDGTLRQTVGDARQPGVATEGMMPTGARLRFTAPRNGPHAGGPPPPRGDGPRGFGGPERPGPPPPRPAPIITIEFEPTLSAALAKRAIRDLWIGIIGSVLLLGGAAVFGRFTRRLETVEASLAERRHLATMGEMSAVMAHEIRNPLAALKGHAQLLAESSDAPHLEEPIKHIVASSMRLETLTTDLLDFARASTVTRRTTDPIALAHDAADHLPPGIVEFELDDAPPTWSMDASAMRRVLTNLLDNAVEASPSGTPVFVEIAAHGGELVLAVHDRGDGLPDDPDRLFEPFVTKRTRGTGLGLAIVRRVAELHGGRAEAFDRSGGGATFRVVIPKA